MDRFMNMAFMQACISLSNHGIPVGSVLVYRDKVIGAGHNKRVQRDSSILHAEMDALENAGRLTPNIYRNSTLYTTLSPCIMCTGAILLYGIGRVVIGENMNFMGEEELLRSRGVDVVVLQDALCINMMQSFISKYPELWNEDIGV